MVESTFGVRAADTLNAGAHLVHEWPTGLAVEVQLDIARVGDNHEPTARP